MKKNVNIIAVFNYDMTQLLFCKRRKDPYKGMYNFVGGKIEPGEASLDAAYRELREETGITKEDIILTHLMDTDYFMSENHLEVYCGRLNKPFEVHGDENELVWLSSDTDLFDLDHFAGEGILGHILEEIKGYGDMAIK